MLLGWKLKQIHEAIQRQANKDLQEMDLTLSQHHALLYLSAREDHTAELKELERHFCVAQATMAGIAQRLECKGYVTALQHPTDRRVKRLRLTEQGLEISRRSAERIRGAEQRMTAGLRPEEAGELSRLLDVIYENLRDSAD
jgi:DNA-binding MarR family transcriptional regulator